MITPRERPLLATDRVALALRNGTQTQDRRPVNGKNGKARKAAYQVEDLVYVRECFGYMLPDEEGVVWRASEPGYMWWSDDAKGNRCAKWKPNIHMPKRIARTWLRVLTVDREWLPDLSEADAIAEGCHGEGAIPGDVPFGDTWEYKITPQQEFWKMWAEIYPTAEMYVWRYGLELAQR